MLTMAAQPDFSKAITAITGGVTDSPSLFVVLRDDLSFLEITRSGSRGTNGDSRPLKAVLDKQAKFFPGGISPTFFPGVIGKGG